MKNKLLIVFIYLLVISYQIFAQGDLMITPNRVVFDGNKHKEDLNLVNTGKDTATYTISFVNYRMNEDGSFTVVEKPDPGQMFADSYLRIFPRKVTLAPGEPQSIALQCKRKQDMKAGECRSHLYFRSEKNYNALSTKNKDTAATISVQLTPIYGMAIPIIIRSGLVDVKAVLSDLRIESKQDTIQNLTFFINRTGNISIYGNIIVDYIPIQGKPYQIGIVKGIGVYTNINKRSIGIQLNKASGITFKSGKLKVQYISSDEKNPIVYSIGELELK